MENLQTLWNKIIKEESLIAATFSSVRNKNETPYTQVRLKPILIKDELHYHLEYVFATKVTHENLLANELYERTDELSAIMKQINIYTLEHDYQILISKKMKVTIIEKKPSKTKDSISLLHNRQKQYIFEDGIAVPFLIELGVMNKEGKVLKNKYNKFRQINRFVELVKDVTGDLPKNKKLRIVDFGCDKSYLTFALHYYLKDLCGLNIEIVGLDLKDDVINTCNNLSKKLNLTGIRFLVGDIEHFNEYDQVDMVVSLHACNTATDAALAKAIGWNSKVILSVPCCHNELYTQINNDILSPILDYGIIKERFAALATDGIRAQLLEISGYRTQLVEFIDMEHTPKNIMIRASKSGKSKDLDKLISDYKNLTAFLSARPSLETMLDMKI